ncbi:MAG: hypothetical protein VXB01_01445 [Opitutae bacterium]
MNKKQIKELIDDGFNRLYPLTLKGWRDHRDEMYQYEYKLQKHFRSTNPLPPAKCQQNNATVAKYFVLNAIRDAIYDPQNFRPRDILHCKQSYLIAHALADDDRFDLQEMFIGFDWFNFDQIEFGDADLSFKSTEEAA